jgi:hypothetical protein
MVDEDAAALLGMYLVGKFYAAELVYGWPMGLLDNGEAKALVVEAFDDCHTVAAGFSGGTIFASAAKAAA